MGPGFSCEENDILVEEIAKHPSLWQLSHAQYKDQRLKDNIWAEVAESVGKPVADCKKRWKNIKDTYDRKKIKKTGSAAPPANKKGKSWPLEEKLAFLRSAEDHRKSFSNVDAVENDEVIDVPVEVELRELDDNTSSSQNSEEPLESPSPSTSSFLQQISFQQSTTSARGATSNTSRRTNNRGNFLASLDNRSAEGNDFIKNIQSSEENGDEIDLFFESIAKSVKKLPPHLQHRAKVETLSTLGRLEAEMWRFH